MKDLDLSMLTKTEVAVYRLRALYKEHGYTPYKMSKFEAYDLYARNKNFLVSDNIITFTDHDGKLMALKPDVTLSIVREAPETPGTIQKVYYNENVYRVPRGEDNFKEIMQVGIECVGDLDISCVNDVLTLAADSLSMMAESDNYVLDVTHLGIISAVLDNMGTVGASRKQLLNLMGEKNLHEIKRLCTEEGIDEQKINVLCQILSTCGKGTVVLDTLKTILAKIPEVQTALAELTAAVTCLSEAGHSDCVQIDFSVIHNMSYYNGLVFRGFVRGLSKSILSGGQYDALLARMGKKSRAIGFAVYMDQLSELDVTDGDLTIPVDGMLNVALPKGRLGEKVYDMFEKAGFPCPSIKENSRKLIFENPECGVRYFWVKPSDVAIYVERGAADIGVAGKDILLEYKPDVYELCDLKTGKCRMAVAAPVEFTDDGRKTLKVATKFSNIAKTYYAGKSRDIDIIHLNGSIEIAPILGLSDVIVDIVETGTTLKENNLEVKEEILPISARFIANKSGYKFKREAIDKIVSGLEEQLQDK
ncbi:MAG: ATP phosphoribosyltransferase [Clostridia bacterium]|nr:ATP phosphoribosyltransferase [Clostridia bacterium]